MFGFMKSSAARFAEWAFPLVMRGDALVRLVEQDTEIPESTKEAFKSWAEIARSNYEEISYQIKTGYGLPELEALRAETCANIVHGHWQSAVCLTNILLESFLKLALVYKSARDPNEKAKPLRRLMNSLSDPVKRYMRKKLNATIDAANKLKLIDNDTKERLHGFRNKFRDPFFHADIQSMFGDKSIPVTGLDFGTREMEKGDVPIGSLPLLLGEAIWQNAEANAIPYFKEVDALIRETLPKVFPHMTDSPAEDPSNGGKG